MSLFLRANKTGSPFLFWRTKKSTKTTEPTRQPLRIKVMRRSESDAFYANYAVGSAESSSETCAVIEAASTETTIDEVTSSTNSVAGGNKENDHATAGELFEAPLVQIDHSELCVEVPLVVSETQMADMMVPKHEPAAMDRESTDAAMSDTAGSTIPNLAHVPSNLEILEDLRCKLLSEKMKLRVAELASASGPSSSARTKLEPDETLVKPPKKLPSRSYIEYRRDLFKCDEKYEETDPPGHLVPGAESQKDDIMDAGSIGHLSAIARSANRSTIAMKRPDPDEMVLVAEMYPKAKIPSVPAEAKSGEDVAMHEIMTAINMFVSPEYDIHETASDFVQPEVPSEDEEYEEEAFIDCFEPNKRQTHSSSTSVIGPSGRTMNINRARSDSSNEDGLSTSSSTGYIKNQPSYNAKFMHRSPVGVNELEQSSSSPTRSRSMDLALMRDEDEFPRDEELDKMSECAQVRSAGYGSLSRDGSHDECSPIKRCGSEGVVVSRETTTKLTFQQGYADTKHFHFSDAPIVRKIDFGDDASKNEDLDDDDESASNKGELELYQKLGGYVAFKDGKDSGVQGKSENPGPSVATNVQEIWYDCAYLFDVVSDEFWSGLLGEDDLDAASVNANGLDGHSLDGSAAESLVTDEDEQYILNRKRQKMWRSYRRKLQLAKKETDV